jgi:hypothetical protein
LISKIDRLDTTPGHGGYFAPPQGFTGGTAEYRSWMRQKFSHCRATAQQLVFVARLMHLGHVEIECVGPFAGELKAIMITLNSSKKK